jgi:hypothetical protein
VGSAGASNSSGAGGSQLTCDFIPNPGGPFTVNVNVASTFPIGATPCNLAASSSSWSWGDMTAASTTNAHTYTAVGIYTLTLTVTYADGSTASKSGTVRVVPVPTVTSPVGVHERKLPVFAWIQDAMADKYRVLAKYGATTVIDKTYSSTVACSTTPCTIDSPQLLAAGSYTWWIYPGYPDGTWNPSNGSQAFTVSELVDKTQVATSADCQSGYRSGGVCCNTPCQGKCESCTLPGSVGVCRVLPVGTTCRAAVDACDVAETCDGVSTSCPENGLLKAGTPCGTGSICNGRAPYCPARTGLVSAMSTMSSSAPALDCVCPSNYRLVDMEVYNPRKLLEAEAGDVVLHKGTGGLNAPIFKKLGPDPYTHVIMMGGPDTALSYWADCRATQLLTPSRQYF